MLNVVEVMDVMNINYESNSFDLAIDKSTIDALLCGENSFLNVAKMTNEVQRVLKEGGMYMVISYGQPENRLFHFEREHLSFDITVYTIKKDYQMEEDNQKYEKTHYVYLCKKKDGADLVSEQNFLEVYSELEKQEKMEEELLSYNDNDGSDEDVNYFSNNGITYDKEGLEKKM